MHKINVVRTFSLNFDHSGIMEIYTEFRPLCIQKFSLNFDHSGIMEISLNFNHSGIMEISLNFDHPSITEIFMKSGPSHHYGNYGSSELLGQPNKMLGGM